MKKQRHRSSHPPAHESASHGDSHASHPAHPDAQTTHSTHAHAVEHQQHEPAPPTRPHQGRAQHGRSHPSRSPQHKPRLVKHSGKGGKRLPWGIVIGCLLLLILAGALVWRKKSNVSGMANSQTQAVQQGPMVETATVTQTPAGKIVLLEGEARAYFEATLYAKVSGYLSGIFVDAGSRVKAGQLLAHISSPETDQAVKAAQADFTNKNRIARRYRVLLRKQLIAEQEAEQYFTAADTARATLLSRKQQETYEDVIAPFDGTVTARLVDPGDLIPDASSSKSAPLALLSVAHTDRLRVDAYVDQKYAPYVHAGLPVRIFLPDRHDDPHAGVIARVAGALDRYARMLPIEVDVENTDQKIVAGSFVQMELKVPVPSLLSIPDEALLNGNGKTSVAVLGNDMKVRFMPLTISDNNGTNVTYTEGPPKGTRVALNLGDEIRDGMKVRVKGAGGEGKGKDGDDKDDKSQDSSPGQDQSKGGDQSQSQSQNQAQPSGQNPGPGPGHNQNQSPNREPPQPQNDATAAAAPVIAPIQGKAAGQSGHLSEKQQKQLDKESKKPERGVGDE